MKKAKKLGATSEQIAEIVGVTLGVAGAAIVDRSDIANHNLGDLFHMDIS
jgi:alkylhydroperoxidase/carboxymuconolactone decarboxylase family protein YurZ